MQTICPVGDVATPGVDALAIDKERYPTFFQWLFERPGEQVFFDQCYKRVEGWFASRESLVNFVV
jgi:hypothetical protein